jgi:hypothetical protein
MTGILSVIWLLVMMQYDHSTKHVTFPTQEQCETARSFLTLSTRDSFCVDP